MMRQRLLAGLLALVLLTGLTTPASAAGLPFRDVPAGSWFYASVADLYNRKLVSGYDAYTFLPDGTVTLGEALKLILLASGYGAQSPVDGAVMLINWGEHRYLRKIKVLNDRQVLLQSYDREYEQETADIADVGFLARCVQVTFEL